jgi:hypothetical protein
VVLVRRCPPEEFFCPDFNKGFFCAQMPCKLARATLAPPSRQITLTLVPPNTNTIYVE